MRKLIKKTIKKILLGSMIMIALGSATGAYINKNMPVHKVEKHYSRIERSEYISKLEEKRIEKNRSHLKHLYVD